MTDQAEYSCTAVEVPLVLVDFDGERARRDTDSYIYSDLLIFYSLGGSRPGAVTAELADGRVLVRSRARYVAIAEDLGLGAIDCLFPARTPRAQLAEFLQRPDVRVTSTAKGGHGILGPAMEWHAIGLDRPPGDAELTRFTELMRDVFADQAHPAVDVARADSDPAVLYFQAWTPHDRDTGIRLLAALQGYDHDVIPVRTYRGGRFRHPLRS